MLQSLRAAASEVRRPGESGLDGPELARVGRAALTVVIVQINLIGAAAVLAIALFVVPLPSIDHAGHLRAVNALVALGYVALACPLGAALGIRGLFRVRRWLAEDRPPTAAETRLVIQAPLRLFAVQLGLWLAAAVVFGVLDATYSGSLGVRVAIIVLITGLVTGSCTYLVSELLLRPAAVRAMVDGAPSRLAVPGVATRSLLAWVLGTGLPLFGLVAIGILALSGDREADRHQLGIAMVTLGGVGIVVGLIAVSVAARATADPVESVRRALARVQRGEFDVRVPVYDGTQIGQLQLGFNAMVKGLAERDRIREAFGTYVDPEIAARVLEEGTNLAGEAVEVTIMFVDVRGFTSFAERTPADQVVAAINELFEQIVPIIHEAGGRVDKFVGDGLLAVFGAPRRLENHADCALAVALEICRTLESSHDLQIGIGLNSGEVVAGNVGGAGRLEFSVIGDAVNVAARVQAATRQTGDAILITEFTAGHLSDDHPALEGRDGIELRGRQEPVKLYAAEPDQSRRPPSRGTGR